MCSSSLLGFSSPRKHAGCQAREKAQHSNFQTAYIIIVGCSRYLQKQAITVGGENQQLCASMTPTALRQRRNSLLFFCPSPMSQGQTQCHAHFPHLLFRAPSPPKKTPPPDFRSQHPSLYIPSSLSNFHLFMILRTTYSLVPIHTDLTESWQGFFGGAEWGKGKARRERAEAREKAKKRKKTRAE